MKFTQVWILAVILLFVGSTLAQVAPKDLKYCNTRLEDFSPCATVLPYCQAYTYDFDDDADLPNKYVFKCVTCDEGFVPIPGGKANITKNPYDDWPNANFLPNGYLPLCKRVYTPSVLMCSNTVCRNELVGCLRYTVTNIIDNADGSQWGTYTCIEARDFFEVYQPAVRVSTNPDVKKAIAQRVTETRDCGPFCQEEFPNCIQYRSYKPEIRASSEGAVAYSKFICLKPAIGFEVAQTIQTLSANPLTVKNLVIPAYLSSPVACSTPECWMKFPHCKRYTSRASVDNSLEYMCLECVAPFISRNTYVANTFSVCKPTAAAEIKTDIYYTDEIPGCNVFKMNSVVDTLGAESSVYECTSKKDGYDYADSSIYIPVWNSTNPIKYRLSPVIVSAGTVCDANCRKKLPYCNKYSRMVISTLARPVKDTAAWACQQCDSGYEPTSEPFTGVWTDGSEAVVCRHTATPGPVACDSECKKSVPNCDEVSISRDASGKNEYRCTRCSSGFFPIQYEVNNPGFLSAKSERMRNKNVVYLCSEKESEVYIDIVDCRKGESAYSISPVCRITQCEMLIKVKDMTTDNFYSKCVRCPAGYNLRTASETHIYDYDQTLCKQTLVPTSTQSE